MKLIFKTCIMKIRSCYELKNMKINFNFSTIHLKSVLSIMMRFILIKETNPIFDDLNSLVFETNFNRICEVHWLVLISRSSLLTTYNIIYNSHTFLLFLFSVLVFLMADSFVEKAMFFKVNRCACFSTKIFIVLCPVRTQRRFNVYTTLFQQISQNAQYNCKIAS